MDGVGMKLTSHDGVLGAKEFGDLAHFDSAVDVLHNVIWNDRRIGKQQINQTSVMVRRIDHRNRKMEDTNVRLPTATEHGRLSQPARVKCRQPE